MKKTPKKSAAPKSPLAGVAEALKNMTPEETAAWRRSVREAVAEREAKKKSEDKANSTGVCVVCSGEVISRPVWDSSRLGGPARSLAPFIYCTQCGLRYAFLPKKKVSAVK